MRNVGARRETHETQKKKGDVSSTASTIPIPRTGLANLRRREPNQKGNEGDSRAHKREVWRTSEREGTGENARITTEDTDNEKARLGEPRKTGSRIKIRLDSETRNVRLALMVDIFGRIGQNPDLGAPLTDDHSRLDEEGQTSPRCTENKQNVTRR